MMNHIDDQRPAGARPVAPSHGALRPLGIGEVQITGGFWAGRQAVNANATLDHCLTSMERLGWVENFRSAATGLARERPGREFSDSEIYKLAEAMAWEVARAGNGSIGTVLDKLAADIAPAQQADGYLNTAFGGPGQAARYSDLEWGHELYCVGHLIQAGVARARVRGGADELTEIAIRAADHVCGEFGPGNIDGICGHPGIETALVELARLTGEQRYLDQAALFVDRRGHGLLSEINLGRAYFQDDVPVRDARVLRGHAVRALYLAAGAVDVAIETGDDALLEAVVGQWEATVARRTYLTGGMGARHVGEAFGEDFELPPDRAYSETCAGVAAVMLSWRLLLATGDPRYADLIERTLFNVVATSPAADGRAFFYANTLHRRTRAQAPSPDVPSPRAVSGLRASWFEVSCCPTNVARLLASLSGYLATVDGGGLQIHQYADAEISTRLADGRPIKVDVRTGYPDGGVVTVTVTDPPPGEATISLRVPHWARGEAKLTDPDGQVRPAADTSVELRRVFATGDVIRLELPVSPRFTVPDPRIDAVRGSVAVERGPVVLCVESPDLPSGSDVDAVRVDPTREPEVRGDAVVVDGALVEATEREWPYGDGRITPLASRDAEITLRPYHSWAERGPSTMRVWIPTT